MAPSEFPTVEQIALRLRSQFASQGRQVVSIVGSGGKTTLMWRLAYSLVATGARVLVSTTTKIRPPTEKDLLPGIAVAGTVNETTGKLEAPPFDELRALCACFDYAFLEADGSAGKPLKAWAAYEPVVYDYTTMTIAVLPLCSGMTIEPATVHRLPLFTLTAGVAQGEAITTAHLARIIQGGLFYRSYGTKVLVMNCQEGMINHKPHEPHEQNNN
jgi:hypothetical protein